MKRLMLVACMAAQVATASSPADFALVAPIEIPAESAAWQVELENWVYSVSIDPDLRDMAIFNADGQAVPMKIWPFEYPDSSIEQRASVPMFALPGGIRDADKSDLRLLVERDASGRLRRLETLTSNEPAGAGETREWLLDIGAFDRGIDHLRLDWDEPSNDVIARFEVRESGDLQRWHLLNAGTTLVVLEKDGARIENQLIPLPTAKSRYLRLRRLDEGTPLLGLRAEAFKVRHLSGAPRVRWVEAQSIERLGDLTASRTRHLYTLPVAAPYSEAMITLSDDNALAQVDVLTPFADRLNPTRWSLRARLVAFRLREGNEVIEVERIPLANGKPRVAKFRIDSETPLASPPHLTAGFLPTRLLFLAEGRGPFVLAVGSATARHADYPIDTALTSLRARFGKDWQPPKAGLADPQISAGAAATRQPDQPTNWKSWMLWTVLILAAAMVGGLSLSLLRGAGQRGTEDRQQPPEE